MDLKGRGVLVGFLDTGIDYTQKGFQYEDGTSKIQYIWDQTVNRNSPAGYYYGEEYTNEQINTALKSQNPYDIVPHKDNTGHGTKLALLAASRENNEYIGAAPDSEIIVVKLRKARGYYTDFYNVIPTQENVFESTDIMMGIEYLLEKAIQLNMPLAICIGLGTNIGGHNSFDDLEEYFSNISGKSGICICTAAGNESHTGHHTDGKLNYDGEYKDIEIRVPENSYSFQTYLWNISSDRLSVAVQSPNGETIERVPAKSGSTLEANFAEGCRVNVQYFFPTRGAGDQVTIVKIINPIPGIWKITAYGDIIIDGTYHVWLPITGFVSEGIEFLSPTPNYTIVVPSTSIGSITCSAYNNRDNILYEESSWGPTRMPVISPDLTAPGVDIQTSVGTITGTSASASITTGGAALMLQWGIVDRNDITLNTYRIRAFLIRGCTREENIEYPSLQWGYGKLNLLNTFNQIRTT